MRPRFIKIAFTAVPTTLLHLPPRYLSPCVEDQNTTEENETEIGRVIDLGRVRRKMTRIFALSSNVSGEGAVLGGA